ncbi:hypothetical protein AVEN_161375-1 [Araneus ventricosus]|uniref:Uncharacterized protein n=2 Tax=Araneus ventricosus TaxID=182803 RepID=A0A4Y2TLY5_ARAVE|nr:hypothetical protein AVEN_161375-1 [Araneus ventricosus]
MLFFRRGEKPQLHSEEFQPLWLEISATYVRGAARKCFRAMGRNTGWGCRNTQNGFHSAKPLLFHEVVFGWGEIPQPHPDEFQSLWSEISATCAQGAARKCFRAKGRNTGWGCR